MREGAALLQGLAVCGHCGRKLHTHYRGREQAPGYHCSNKGIVNGRGVYCLNVGGMQIDAAVTQAFLSAIAPAGLHAVVQAAEQLQADHHGALTQWHLALSTMPSVQSDVTALSIPRIVWSHVGWKPSGRKVCVSYSMHAPNSHVANSNGLMR